MSGVFNRHFMLSEDFHPPLMHQLSYNSLRLYLTDLDTSLYKNTQGQTQMYRTIDLRFTKYRFEDLLSPTMSFYDAVLIDIIRHIQANKLGIASLVGETL